MSTLLAPGYPEAEVRSRARSGASAALPGLAAYGSTVFGADLADLEAHAADPVDRFRLVPPVFVPQRLAKLIDLGREPTYRDVDLTCAVGGFAATMPLYVSAFGSTKTASTDLGLVVSRQAGQLGLPLVIGENVTPVNGYGRRLGDDAHRSMLGRAKAYEGHVPDGVGGLVVQQSTEDADAEVWNLAYSDPGLRALLDSGRLAFELKVGQGAKPGLGGMTVVDPVAGARLASAYLVDPLFRDTSGAVLRSSSPGTFSEEILRQQVRLMRNNYPRARVWVKLPPARDVRAAAFVAWEAGADAVTVDGAEAGTGWAPVAFMPHVGLPLGECLRRIGDHPGCLLVSGRMWEGARAAKCLALGARAVGLGRAALIAADTDDECGLVNLVHCLALELRMLISALGKYQVSALGAEDLWAAGGACAHQPGGEDDGV